MKLYRFLTGLGLGGAMPNIIAPRLAASFTGLITSSTSRSPKTW